MSDQSMLMIAVDQIDYLRDAAMHYGPAWRYWSRADRLELHGAVWTQLAAVHGEISRREDLPLIMATLARRGASTREREMRRQLRGLLRLLRELGMQKVQPFDSPVLTAPQTGIHSASGRRSVCATPCERLPARLRYLIRRASTLGITPHWDSIASFIDRVNEKRFNAICDAVMLMRRRGDDLQLRDWLNQTDTPSSHDADIARSLLHVIDALEIF